MKYKKKNKIKSNKRKLNVPLVVEFQFLLYLFYHQISISSYTTMCADAESSKIKHVIKFCHKKKKKTFFCV